MTRSDHRLSELFSRDFLFSLFAFSSFLVIFHNFLLRVNTAMLTRDIDIAILFVCLSVRLSVTATFKYCIACK